MDEKRVGPKMKSPISDYKYELMRVPPSSVDAEEAVLGAIMLQRNALPLVMSLLHSSDLFYKPSHTLIFEAIINLQEQSMPVDIMTVTNQLKKNGTLGHVGGPFEVTQLTNRVASSANIEYHCAIIIEQFLKREAIRIGQEITRNGYDETTDPFEVVGNATVQLSNLIGANIGHSDENIRDTAIRILAEGIESGKDKSKRLLTGYKAIDEMITYMEKGDLIIIAGRPGMGKTALAMGITINIVFQQCKPVAFFSLEMQKEPLVRRILSVMGEIDGEKLKSSTFSYEENKRIEDVLEKFRNAPLYIEDKPAITIIELRSRAIYLKNKYGIRLLVVDYLQLMKGTHAKSNNRESEIAEISRGLKAIAKELKIPIIALAQLSRETEKRGGDKKPQLSDLRESGAIEQDADEVWFPYRPEYYGKTQDANGNSVLGIAQISRAKARNGRLKTVVLKWDDKYTRFSDFEEVKSFSSSPDPPIDTTEVDSDF